MRFPSSIGAVLLPFVTLVPFASGIQFNPDDEASLKAATKQYAYGLMTHYKNNATGTSTEDIGIFPKPLYWWEAGAAWGGMIEYTQLTGDASYVNTLTQALVANYGPNNDIIVPWRQDQEGNDDQAFWAFSVMSALEYQFPNPEESAAPATYLEVVENCFNNIVSRWDTTSCNGGLKWQIYPSNAYGYNYKNSISNGATFALAARLARYTGNQTYADWAVKIWDWSQAVGLVSDKYEVFDGTDDTKNCSDQDRTEWSYNVGVYLHGAATLYNYTKGDETWKTRTSGLLDHSSIFFQPYDNATNIMYEAACETGDKGRTCNLDQQSFKAYLSRFLAKTAIMAPYTKDKVTTWLRTSAVAAAKSCTGGADGSLCGSKWYVGAWDGTSGVGQQLSALEVTQALLTLKQNIVPGTGGDAKPYPSSSATPVASSTPSPIATSTLSTFTVSSISSLASPEASDVSNVVSASSVTFTAAIGSSAAAISATAPAGSTTEVPGEFDQNGPVASTVTSCTPSTTVTVYVPPSAPAIPTPSVPTTPNYTVPASPPANTTGPEQFPGAASNAQVTGYSLVAALAVALIGGLL